MNDIWIKLAELPSLYASEPLFFRALLAALMVGITCGVLGCFFVLRNMALIGDALSHAVLPGLVIAFVIGGYSVFGFFIGSTLAGLVTAILITWISQNVMTKADAAIGIVFTFMFAVGIIMISKVSRSGVHLDMQHFLFGNLLGIRNSDLYLTGAVMVFVIISIYLFYRYLFVATFQEVIAETMGISVQYLHYFLMLLLSFAVVASLQTVGLIMVVAMLITPASTALLLSNQLRQVIFISAFIGAVSSVLGLSIAIVLDAPPGPALVVVVSLFFFSAALFAPRKGYVFRVIRQNRLRKKIQIEDTLKQALRLENNKELTFDTLSNRLTFNKSMLKKHLRTLAKRGLMSVGDNLELILTEVGVKEANRLVRAHRLWETYLVQEMGLSEEQIHEDAEQYEHLLTDEILDEVDQKLGFPTKDPHGSPIPTKKGFPDFPLFNLDLAEKGIIHDQQINEQITHKLWQLGLLPNSIITLKEKDRDFVMVQLNGKLIKVPAILARKINISVSRGEG